MLIRKIASSLFLLSFLFVTACGKDMQVATKEDLEKLEKQSSSQNQGQYNSEPIVVSTMTSVDGFDENTKCKVEVAGIWVFKKASQTQVLSSVPSTQERGKNICQERVDLGYPVIAVGENSGAWYYGTENLEIGQYYEACVVLRENDRRRGYNDTAVVSHLISFALDSNEPAKYFVDVWDAKTGCDGLGFNEVE